MKALKKIALDMIPVLAGVLIALFINNWKETRTQEVFLEDVLTSIGKQMESSKIDADLLLPRHQALYDTTEANLNNDSTTLLQLFQTTNGLQLIGIENAAWTALLNSNFQLVDYDTFSRLNQLNENKLHMEAQIQRLSDYVMTNPMETSSESKYLLLLHLRNLIDSELQIVDLMEQHLETHPVKR